jgi:hypothetical protein
MVGSGTIVARHKIEIALDAFVFIPESMHLIWSFNSVKRQWSAT